MKTIEEQCKATPAFTKIGEHEIVTCSSEHFRTANLKVCRKCRKEFHDPDSTQKALMQTCVSDALADIPFKVIPRNDFVSVRVKVCDAMHGLKMPQSSMEGKEFYVEGIGPDVKHLKPGDRVLMTGKQGTDWSYIPGFTNLLIIREGNIGLVLEPLPETEEIK
jgi:hypothetical protein